MCIIHSARDYAQILIIRHGAGAGASSFGAEGEAHRRNGDNTNISATSASIASTVETMPRDRERTQPLRPTSPPPSGVS